LQKSEHVGFERELDCGISEVVADLEALVDFRRAPKSLHRDAWSRSEPAFSFKEYVQLHRPGHQTPDAEHAHNIK